ncbi:MAG TPA: hypothetical protein VIF62_20995 [Labilithrix sp.]|jgi:hypothetical protein
MTKQASVLLLLFLGSAACQASVSAKASTSGDANEKATFSDNPPAASQSSAPAPPPQPVTATPANVCPLHCYEARGADKADVSNDELAQIAPAIEPALAKMRACTSPDQWRRYGSPTIHLRIEPDGVVHELDVDPHHRFGDYSCIEDAGRTSSISLALPGRKAVRCAEHCDASPRAVSAKKRR